MSDRGRRGRDGSDAAGGAGDASRGEAGRSARTQALGRGTIQRAVVRGESTGEAGGPPPLDALGAGRPLPGPLAAHMGRAFDADFSAVRVHEGTHVAALGARAFALGDDLHFAPGELAPETERGRELVGHELAHVVQQRQGRVAPTAQAKGAALNDDAALEAEADRAGEAAARGARVGGALAGGAGGGAGGVVQRQVFRRPSPADREGKGGPLDQATADRVGQAVAIELAIGDGDPRYPLLAAVVGSMPDYENRFRVEVAHDAGEDAIVAQVAAKVIELAQAAVMHGEDEDGEEGGEEEDGEEAGGDEGDDEGGEDGGEEADDEGDGKPRGAKRKADDADEDEKEGRAKKRTKTAHAKREPLRWSKDVRRRFEAAVTAHWNRPRFQVRQGRENGADYRRRLGQGRKQRAGQPHRDLDRVAWVLNQLDPTRVCVALAYDGTTFYLFSNTGSANLVRDFNRLWRGLRSQSARHALIRELAATPSGNRSSTKTEAGRKKRAEAKAAHAAKASRRGYKALRGLRGLRAAFRDGPLVAAPRPRQPGVQVHAEQQATQHAIDHELAYTDMGISKLCCRKCWAALTAADRLKLATRLATGTHEKTYDSEEGWPIPDYAANGPALAELVGVEAASIIADCRAQALAVLRNLEIGGGQQVTEPISSEEDLGTDGEASEDEAEDADAPAPSASASGGPAARAPYQAGDIRNFFQKAAPLRDGKEEKEGKASDRKDDKRPAAAAAAAAPPGFDLVGRGDVHARQGVVVEPKPPAEDMSDDEEAMQRALEASMRGKNAKGDGKGGGAPS